MKIELKHISIGELTEGYKDKGEDGVIGYGGKLDVRPPFQREFVYKPEQRDAVINTVNKGYPLNVMYWAVREDGTYEIIDGQQRTISICQYKGGDFSVQIGSFPDNRAFHNLKDEEQKQIDTVVKNIAEGTLNISLGPIENIKNNINTVLNVFSHKIKNFVELTFDIDSSINIKGYDVRLFQLWSNLIKNALESMEDQQGLKTLKLYSETTKDDYFITVENNGPEISEKNQVKIFNKFFTTKGKKKGSGLGLNIVKNVLEEHQGRVVLESNPNFTRFIINFKRDK